MRRLMVVFIAVAVLSVAGRADALTIRDVIELSKAGVSDQVLLALIQMDNRVYTIDADAVKQMKAAGVTDSVMLAMINARRETTAPLPAAVSDQQPEMDPGQAAPSPAIEEQAGPSVVREVQVPVPVPVAVPVAVPVRPVRPERVSTIVTTDEGAAVRVRVPIPANCTKAEPVYWGNGGKRRPGTWEPPTQIVCR